MVDRWAPVSARPTAWGCEPRDGLAWARAALDSAGVARRTRSIIASQEAGAPDGCRPLALEPGAGATAGRWTWVGATHDRCVFTHKKSPVYMVFTRCPPLPGPWRRRNCHAWQPSDGLRPAGVRQDSVASEQRRAVRQPRRHVPGHAERLLNIVGWQFQAWLKLGNVGGLGLAVLRRSELPGSFDSYSQRPQLAVFVHVMSCA